MFNSKSRFCLLPLDHRVEVWRTHRECYADCCTDRVAAFGGCSVMAWGSISVTSTARLVIIGGNLNAVRQQDEILQPVAIPCLHSLAPR